MNNRLIDFTKIKSIEELTKVLNILEVGIDENVLPREKLDIVKNYLQDNNL